MRFGILGPLDVRAPDGTPMDPGGPRPRALLTLLLLQAGRTVPAERLIDGLYGDEPPAGAANALQSQVSRLRKRLSLDIEAIPAGYRLSVGPDDVDVHRFERLAAEGERALTAGDPSRASALLGEALGLWRGPALADLPATFAGRLDEIRLTAAQTRIEAELALGSAGGLVPELRELISAHPLGERLYGQLMRALHADGRPAEALAVYEEVRRVLADELGADPSAELSALHRELLRGREPARGRGVPAQLTRFVGRTDELSRIDALLAGARLVTLTGPGGAGKTRLAAEAARDRADVCWAELAPLAGGEQVPYALLVALGVREGFRGSQGDPVERLIDALEGREVLLVLDNCEHLVDDAARTAGVLLGACPGLRILATSREALGITGEALCPVPPLAAGPAARLFMDRAAAVRPDADLHARVEAVHAICEALDGLPLAIELAAARLRTLTVDELADRLGDRFRLLSRGDRTKAPRHRTLRAVVEWSWELLDEEERDLARRMAVFAGGSSGGATLAAVEAVCGVPYPEDLLASLTEKSFLETTGGRYRMLQTIRAFCAEHLADEGELSRLRDAHAAYFRGLAAQAEPYLRGGGQLPRLATLGAERDNLSAALRHLVGADPRAALRLMADLSWFWRLRGLHGAHVPLARELLAALGDEPPEDLAEEYVLCVINTVAGDGSDPREPQRLARAEAVLASREHALRRPFVVVLWSVTYGPQYAVQERVRRQVGEAPWGLALLDVGLGFQEWFAGRPATSEEHFERALAGFRATGDRWGMANCLDPLGMFADWRGDRERALALLDEGLAHVAALEAPEETADLLHRRAYVLLHQGRLPDSADHFTRSAAMARTAAVPDKVASARRGLGDVARIGGDTEHARVHYEAALELCAANWFSVGETVRTLIGLGRVALAASRPDEARGWFEQGIALCEGPTRVLELADAAEALASVAQDPREAAVLLGAGAGLRGVALAGDPDVAPVEARVRAALAPETYEKAYEEGRTMRSAAVSGR
ncbi:BTAD domain-containing putative transcriptional regulator [Streptomyces sp. NPDC056002]|uniref:BTAD domain-containing putative transcriptional regulator n=1 Tax=Streptomyces sp. NPDC056002 TaxID=3345675 RepID=UPI0035D6AB9A